MPTTTRGARSTATGRITATTLAAGGSHPGHAGPARLPLSPVSDPALPPLLITDVQRTVEAELDRIGPVLDELGARFADAGHALALVGGPVRDAMLGRLQSDLDFTTSARPEVTEQLLKGWADAIWDMGRAFGTIGARKGDWQVEITTYRSETYDPSSRKPEVDYGDSLRRRPGPPRLHGQRDGGEPARPGLRGPVRRRGRPGRTGCSAPRAGPRTRSPTTRCG